MKKKKYGWKRDEKVKKKKMPNKTKQKWSYGKVIKGSKRKNVIKKRGKGKKKKGRGTEPRTPYCHGNGIWQTGKKKGRQVIDGKQVQYLPGSESKDRKDEIDG